MQSQHLFINAVVKRDRSVVWRTAFHFPSGPQQVHGEPTSFVLELRDREGSVLASECLHQDDVTCGCGGDECVWPKKFKTAIPYDVSARRLVILECEKEVLDLSIPDPPKVKLECKGAEDPDSKVISCWWSADAEEGSSLWYLIQWRDRRGVWRGVAPRTQKTEWHVPKSLWGRSRAAAIRILASSGVATGAAGWDGTLMHKADEGRGPRRVGIGLAGVTAGEDTTVELPPVLRAALTRDDDNAAAAGEVSWYSSHGGLYGQGRSLQLSVLPYGVHVLRASVQNSGDGDGEASWLVERTRDGRYLWHRGTVSYPEPERDPGSITSSLERRNRGEPH